METTWHIVSLRPAPARAEELMDRLREAGYPEPVELSRPDSDESWVELYFDSPTEAACAAETLRAADVVRGAWIRVCEARDWQSFWKHHFRRRAVGERWLIVPAWDADEPVPADRIPLVLQPGLSFGTGENFTTRFCLEMVEWFCDTQTVRSMLDAGSGSGILAVAAAKRGVRDVVAFDNDPLCLDSIRTNAERNGVGDAVRADLGDILRWAPDRRFDLVCANLYATLLIRAAPALCRAGRFLAVSGVREFEADGVADALRRFGAAELVRDGDGEWCGMAFSLSSAEGSRMVTSSSADTGDRHE
jgi:ribosomal protein L11 methyltransferase